MNHLHNLESDGNISDVLLRKPKRSILTAKVSIPRVSIDNCDKCGHRLLKISENQDSKNNLSRRPHSVHIAQDNYLYLQQINEVASKNSNFIGNSSTLWFYRLNLQI